MNHALVEVVKNIKNAVEKKPRRESMLNIQEYNQKLEEMKSAIEELRASL